MRICFDAYCEDDCDDDGYDGDDGGDDGGDDDGDDDGDDGGALMLGVRMIHKEADRSCQAAKIAGGCKHPCRGFLS